MLDVQDAFPILYIRQACIKTCFTLIGEIYEDNNTDIIMQFLNMACFGYYPLLHINIPEGQAVRIVVKPIEFPEDILELATRV